MSFSKYITHYSKLQDIIYQGNFMNDLQFPQIIVVGAQSVGKTSLLNSIMGKDVLPQGEGMITACPIILEMNCVQTEKEIGYQVMLEGRKFTSKIDDIQEEIKKAMKAHVGDGKVSRIPLKVKYQNLNIPNLTLVDLPGLIKVVDHGMPTTIKEDIKNLVINYMKQKNSIILAISTGTADLVTSDALELVEELKAHDRTMSIVTKMDIMLSKANLVYFDNKKKYLRYDWHGVRCRNQDEIEKGIDISRAIDEETDLFNNNKLFSAVKVKCGISNLIKKLQDIFLGMLTVGIPELLKNVTANLEEVQINYLKYKPKFDDTRINKTQFVKNTIREFCGDYLKILDGNHKLPHTQFYGGAKCKRIITMFQNEIEKFDPIKYFDDVSIRYRLANKDAFSTNDSAVDKVFQEIIRENLDKIKASCLDVCLEISYELLGIMKHIKNPSLERYNRLNHYISETIQLIIADCLKTTKDKVTEFIEIEKVFINKDHIHYNLDEESVVLDDHDLFFDPPKADDKLFKEEMKPDIIVDRSSFAKEFEGAPTKGESKNIEQVKKHVKVYFNNILKVNLAHCIPNYIHYFMISQVKTMEIQFNQEMIETAAEKHLGVSPFIEEKQKEYEAKEIIYSNAVEILKEMEFDSPVFEED